MQLNQTRSAITIPPYAWAQTIDLKNRVLHTQCAVLQRARTDAEQKAVTSRIIALHVNPLTKG
jgi:hypothetical protein